MISAGIRPRVGMQVKCEHDRYRVTRVDDEGIWFNDAAVCPTRLWKSGHFTIEWMPPNGKERARWSAAAKWLRTARAFRRPNEHGVFAFELACHPGFSPARGEGARIAESLAMDGL